ncbi:hypothetical protein [Streptomyces sp. NPDC001068]|uniref:WXG100 family type VII secretion target n=1 Tax=Streptomyces sp. NPDC001068 TaxID=3364544 RepID=UPI0036CBEA6A
MDINGAIVEWVTRVMQELGDPSSLHDHAQEVSAHAEQLRDLRSTVEETAGNVAWVGPDADAYRQALDAQLNLLTHTADALEVTGAQAQGHAEKAWAIVKQVLGIVLEILEILAVGMLLSWLGGLALDWVLARVIPLMERILEALAKFRGYLAEFTEFLRSAGSTFGSTGARIGEGLGKLAESFFVDSLPAQIRAYPGFYLALAVPKLLSGRPVDWKGNAWQLGVFFGFDTALGLAEGAIKDAGLGAGLKGLLKGDRNLDDAGVAERDAAGAAKTPAEEPAPATGAREAEPADGGPPSEVPGSQVAPADVGGSTTGTAVREGSVPDASPGPGGVPEPQPLRTGIDGETRAPASPVEAPPHVTPAPVRPVDTGAPRTPPVRSEAPADTASTSRSTAPRAQRERGAADAVPSPVEPGRPPAPSAAPEATPVSQAVRGTAPAPRETPGGGDVTSVKPEPSPGPSSLTRATGERTPPEPVHATSEPTAGRAGEPVTAESRSTTGTVRAGTPREEVGSRPPTPTEEPAAAHRGDRLVTESRAGRPETVRAESASRPGEQPTVARGGEGNPHEPVPGRATGPDTAAATRPAARSTATDAAVAARDVRAEMPPRVGTERVGAERVEAGGKGAGDGVAGPGTEGRAERLEGRGGETPAPPLGEAPTPVRDTPAPPPGEVPEPAVAVAPVNGTPDGVRTTAEDIEAILNPGRATDGAKPADPVPASARPGSPHAAEPGPRSGEARGGTQPPSPGPLPTRSLASKAAPRPVDAPVGRPESPLQPAARPSTPASARSEPTVTWSTYQEKSLAEAAEAAGQEAFNVIVGNLATDGMVQRVTGQRMTASEWAFELLGGGLAFARHGIYKWSSVGEKWAYRNQPEGGLVINRWLAETPLSWSYYAMYLTAKDAVKNGVFDGVAYSELNPAPDTP